MKMNNLAMIVVLLMGFTTVGYAGKSVRHQVLKDQANDLPLTLVTTCIDGYKFAIVKGYGYLNGHFDVEQIFMWASIHGTSRPVECKNDH